MILKGDAHMLDLFVTQYPRPLSDKSFRGECTHGGCIRVAVLTLLAFFILQLHI
jgi:hypothetical protein